MGAVEKLEEAKAKIGMEQKMVVDHLIKRVQEDTGLGDDIAQEHKTWAKCWAYIRSKAKDMAKDNCAMVEENTVYEWAEDYFRKDDKKEEEEKAKKKAEEEAKRKASAEKNKEELEKRKAEAAKKAEEEKKKKEEEKLKKGQIEGQMSLFSIIGEQNG